MSFFEKEVVPAQHELIKHKIVAGGMLTHPKTGRIVDYAQAVHDGHFTPNGTFVPPNPFIDTAINIHIGELYQILEQSVDNSVNTVWVDKGVVPPENVIPVSDNSFIGIGESDYGSKNSAKKATEELPNTISGQAKWRIRIWWEKVKETAKVLCPVDYGILQATIRIEPI